MTSDRRCFLFLQGMASQFFAKLGGALFKRGYAVHRINFNGGDRLFWPYQGAADFRGGLDRWLPFLQARLCEWGITDIILFGDCRPHHQQAVRLAEQRGLRVHVFDEGYIRPNYVTLEEGGVNGHSPLPRDPNWFLAAVQGVPEWNPGAPVKGHFLRRASEDVLYNIAGTVMKPLYLGFRTHRPWHPFVEYGGWLYKFSRDPWIKRRVADATGRIAGLSGRYYVFPLQLDCDSQIRRHSSLARMAPWIAHVLTSFRDHAPVDSILVVKEHPLDNALTNWRKLTLRVAAEMGMAERVIYTEGGNLEDMLSRSAGVVTVNSTSGFLAMAFGKPTIALGDAIYDMPGLTFQGTLDDFWRDGQAPDPTIFDAFRRVTVARSQVNGGFFSREGLDLAVAGTIARLEAPAPSWRLSLVSDPGRRELPGVPIASAA
jgi:capsular polysaccharide export protein